MIAKNQTMKQDRTKGKGRKAPAGTAKNEVRPATRKPAPVAATVESAEPMRKDKLVRDSFTLPREDFELIAVLKDRALDFKRPTKKSELLRAGLQVLASLDQTAFHAALEALRPLKAGRPKNKP